MVSSNDTQFPPEKALNLVKKTLKAKQENLIADHESSWNAFCSKSGVQLDDKYLTNTWYEYVIKSFQIRQRSNGILSCNVRGHGFNPLGYYSQMFAASAVVSELLLQSVEDIIRLFTAWPLEKDGSFENL